MSARRHGLDDRQFEPGLLTHHQGPCGLIGSATYQKVRFFKHQAPFENVDDPFRVSRLLPVSNMDRLRGFVQPLPSLGRAAKALVRHRQDEPISRHTAV